MNKNHAILEDIVKERVKIREVELLSDDWYVLKKTTFDYRRKNGTWQTQTRETYDRGNGATILLYNLEQQTVILTRQFRFPAYVNGLADGMLIETAAGLLDLAGPEERIRIEAEEETGYRVEAVEKVLEAYMSPGSVTELLYFFIAPYSAKSKIDSGNTEGIYHDFMAGLIFSCFSLEAKINFVGWRVFRNGWPERASLNEKIELLLVQLKLEAN